MDMSSGPSDRDDITCISWNIHRGRANDGRNDPARLLDVLGREVWQPGAGALFLQEADAEAHPHHGVLDVDVIEAMTGLRHVQSDAAHRSTAQSHGFLGVVAYLGAEFAVQDVRLIDLAGVCPRGAVVIDAERSGRPLRFVVTHLSLSQALRIIQMRAIGQHLRRFDRRPVILCGDLNEWRPWGGLALSRRVVGQALHGPARATFPVRRPVLPLDRILTTAPGRVSGMRVLDGPGIRLVSDHRPVTGRVTLAD